MNLNWVLYWRNEFKWETNFKEEMNLKLIEDGTVNRRHKVGSNKTQLVSDFLMDWCLRRNNLEMYALYVDIWPLYKQIWGGQTVQLCLWFIWHRPSLTCMIQVTETSNSIDVISSAFTDLIALFRLLCLEVFHLETSFA